MPWKAIYYEGVLCLDPRDELRERAKRAELGGDSYVAIPVELAYECAKLVTCGAVYIYFFVQENAPMPLVPEPVPITCVMPIGHDSEHSNGKISWAK